jgi:hypothetical protein
MVYNNTTFSILNSTIFLVLYVKCWLKLDNTLEMFLGIKKLLTIKYLSLLYSILILFFPNEVFSISYYIYDIINLVQNKKNRYKLLHVVVHHLIMIYMMYNSLFFNIKLWNIINILEKSNIAMYFYDISNLLKMNNSIKNVLFNIHNITYIWYRFISLTMYLYINNSLLYNHYVFIIFVYILSIYYFFKNTRTKFGFKYDKKVIICENCKGFGFLKNKIIIRNCSCNSLLKCYKCENNKNNDFVDCNMCNQLGVVYKKDE